MILSTECSRFTLLCQYLLIICLILEKIAVLLDYVYQQPEFSGLQISENRVDGWVGRQVGIVNSFYIIFFIPIYFSALILSSRNFLILFLLKIEYGSLQVKNKIRVNMCVLLCRSNGCMSPVFMLRRKQLGQQVRYELILHFRDNSFSFVFRANVCIIHQLGNPLSLWSVY